VVRALPLTEAHVLRILFEEESAHQYRQNKKMEDNTRNSGNSDGYRTEIAFSDEDEEEAVYADVLEE
jgi:hypothetical protein